MNPKQTRFVAEYLVDRCGAAAARRAGYAPRCAKVTASRLLTRANVKAQIDARERAEAQRLELDRQAIVGKLLECAAMARAQANPAAMVTAWREIGRLLGYYAPERREVRVRGGVQRDHEIRSMSEAELLRLAELST